MENTNPEEGQAQNPQTNEQTTQQTADNFSFITVKVGQLPGRIVDVALNGGRKVSDALAGAGLNPSGREIRVNSVLQNTEFDLSEGDIVLVVGRIKGN